MKTLKNHIGEIGSFIFELIIGILLLINPVGFTSGIVIAAGILLMLLAIKNCVGYFRSEPREAMNSHMLAKGLALLLAGGFCTFRSGWFVATFPILTVLYGIAVLMGGIFKLQLGVDLARLKSKRWYLPLISAGISIICSIVILQSPFVSTAALWMFIGIVFIVQSIFDIVAVFTDRDREEG